jgi:hypothetical protein
MNAAAPRPTPPASPGRLPVISSAAPPKPAYARPIEVALRTVHIVSMGLVLGGIAMGGTHETLRVPVYSTVASGALLLAASLRWGCFHLNQGAGYALLLKLALLGLGNVVEGARLPLYMAATGVTSVGSHMTSTWRHFSFARRASRSGG